MIFIGHLGITLFLCAPLANVLVTSGSRIDVPRWVGVALVVTLLPDLDFVLPWFTHRGVSHTLLAAVCLGVVVAVATELGWEKALVSSGDAVRRLLVGFLLGTGSIISHLLGDIITPMGIQPLFPFGSVYSLDLVYAKDIEANLALLLVGVVVFTTVYRLSEDPVPSEGPTPSDPTSESEFPPFSP